MAVSPKVVFKCNHIIDDSVIKYGNIDMVRRADNYPDVPPASIKMLRVDRVFDSRKEYTLNYHYNQKTSPNIIEWNPLTDIPSNEASYTVQCLYSQVSAEKFDIEDCPRCAGNGWYLNLFDNNVQMVEGSEKLMQDTIKVLFTERKGTYGSNLKDILSQTTYNETELDINISTAIESCEEQIKQQQSEELSNGCTLTPEETLLKIELANILFVRKECCCYITINVVNALGNSTVFTFVV